MHSYPSIFALGHRAVADILTGSVTVQEKVDGSQFSFQLVGGKERIPGTPESTEVLLVMKSKGARVFENTEDKLFKPAVDTVVALANAGHLIPGWTYRGEVLAKPKHNVLAYDRTPVGNIILFDVDNGEESYHTPEEVRAIAHELGLEAVPTLFEGLITSLEQVHAFLDRVSVLGGSKIEGVVIKAYGTYGPDKKTLMAKYVSEGFKENHKKAWGESNPGRSHVILKLIATYKTPARWQKAVQHLRESGLLQEAPQDIGPLMKEVAVDVLKEEGEEIKEILFKHFWPQLSRGIISGLPQWYKDQLAQAAFTPTSVADIADPRPVIKETPCDSQA